jgi:hypothetical protein
VGDLRPGEPHEKGERRVDREPDDYGELPARGHDVVLRCARPPDERFPQRRSGLRLRLGSGGRVRRVHQCRLAVDFSFSFEAHPYLYGHLDGSLVCRIDQTDQAQ